MLHVAESYAAGHDFNQAAVDAGFASASHSSGTFRAMFGLTPTAFASVEARLDIDEQA